MRTAAKAFWAVLFGVVLFVGNSIFAFGAGTARTINLPDAEGNYILDDDDDEAPEVTARVGRISFIDGSARIRRAETEEWEKASLNLPVVEGDEITTEANTRLEIQFDKNQHLRLAENAYLKIVTLKDEGIAVSLSLGSMNLRVVSFDKDKSFFEIDAPKTTLAIQRSGAYRVDAGKQGDTEVRLSATEGGEARVYSDSAGFTVKNGRSARISIDGATAGEWETAEASRFSDDFDSWSSARDAVIAKRLKDAYYDKYYDNDIYGADDLNDHGAWVHTRDYGYVWRPHRASINLYADWSPYRYGHWRWMPPYGWIWVNDEPWGWATYHHGRWFYDDGYWNWSPYGYYRHRRSWWSPALVVISIFSNNICWYPTPYYRRHHDYNSHYRRRRGPYNNPPAPQVNPTETAGIIGRVKGVKGKDNVPPGGVVTIGSGDFGKKISGIRTAPPSVAKSVLIKNPGDTKDGNLPDPGVVGRRINPDFKAERPKVDPAIQGRVGAAKRKADTPLDEELRSTRIFGGRPPQKTGSEPAGIKLPDGTMNEPRKTGAIQRIPSVKPRDTEPRITPPSPKESPRYDQPAEVVQPRKEPPAREPRITPPSPKESPRYEQPAPKERPRDNPPVKQPPRSDPPPKSEPKPEAKPIKPLDGAGKKSPDNGVRR